MTTRTSRGYAPNLHGARLMDVLHCGQVVHPHAVHKKSLRWLQTVFTRYYHGHKQSSAGKPIMVAPVGGPWQVLPPCFEWNDLILTEVSEAPDLIEGAKLAEVGVRSLHDVMLLQSAKRPRCFEHNFGRDSFRPVALPLAPIFLLDADTRRYQKRTKKYTRFFE